MVGEAGQNPANSPHNPLTSCLSITVSIFRSTAANINNGGCRPESSKLFPHILRSTTVNVTYELALEQHEWLYWRTTEDPLRAQSYQSMQVEAASTAFVTEVPTSLDYTKLSAEQQTAETGKQLLAT